MNFISEHQAASYANMGGQTDRTTHDFGPKNLALIVVVAAVLGVLAWEQKPVRLAALQQDETKEAIKLAGSGSGQVLGANTVNQELLDQFANIQVSAITDNSQRAFINYTNQFHTAAQGNFLSELISNTEPSSEMIEKQNKFLEDLQNIAVPSQLADYHRLTIAYYSLYFLYGQGLLGEESQLILDSLQTQLAVMRDGYRVSASVELP